LITTDRYVVKFILFLMIGATLLQVIDYSITYYALHSSPYFEEIGIMCSWTLSFGGIGWVLMALFKIMYIVALGSVCVLLFRKYKTLVWPIVASIPIYVSGIYAVTNNVMLMTRSGV
jgi:hypothetical protein